MSLVNQLLLDLGDNGPRQKLIDTKTGRVLAIDGRACPPAPPKPRKTPAPKVARQPGESFTKRVRAARKLGEDGAERARTKADDVCPGFSTRAHAFILNHAGEQLHGNRFRGEDLVNAMKASGIVPHDDRAFGSIFAKAIRDGVLEPVDSAPRTKGHGAPGGQIYVRGPSV